MAYSQLISTYLATGTHASRPATPNVASGVTCVYYETDTLNAFVWTGSAWVQINGSGAVVQISQQKLSATQATVSFTSIPGSYTDLIVAYTARGTNADNAGSFAVQCNGDTGANYDWGQMINNNGTQTDSVSSAQTSAVIGMRTGANAAAAQAASGEIVVPNYAGTTFYKTLLGTMHADQIAGGSGLQGGLRTASWHNTTAITSLAFTPDTGSFATGTVFTLWGRT